MNSYIVKGLNSKLIVLAVCLFLSGCTSASYPDVQQIMINLSQSFPPVWDMVVALSYLIGILFIARAIYALKIYGEQRTMASQGPSMKIPVTLFFVGAMLMYLPSSKSVVLMTIFGYSEPQPLSYITSNPAWSAQATQVVLQLVQLLGLIAFVRGWVYLAQTQSHNPGQHTFGKAMTHIIGGILAINIEGTREVLLSTLGISG